MKIKLILFVIGIFTICSISCFALTTTISGTVDNKKVKDIRIGIYSDPIEWVPINYKVNMKKNGLFTTSFDLNDAAYGFIVIDNVNYNVFVSPGKKISFKVINKTISFQGSLQYENQFLRHFKDAQWNYTNYNLDLSPDSNYVFMKAKQKELRELFAADNKHSLFSPDFIAFFYAEDDCRFNKFLINFRFEYAGKHNLFISDPIFSKWYANPISFYTDERYVKAPSYINTIDSYMDNSPVISLIGRKRNISKSAAKNLFLLDSLSGKTRDYIMGYEIFVDLQFKGKPDPILIDNFNKTAKDTYAINTVNNLVNAFKFRSEFKGKPLPDKLKKTVLVDTKGKELALGDLISRHYGKALYIDVWGFYCSPCRAQMPFARKLEKEYVNKPIEFISITADSGKELQNWNQYFKIAGTKNNQYRFKKGFDAELLKELNIISEPQYLVIDKQGRLIEYNAPTPIDANELRLIFDNVIKID